MRSDNVEVEEIGGELGKGKEYGMEDEEDVSDKVR